MPKKRVLSDFLCRELLFDFVTNRLDRERVQAVEECLAESEDVRDDLRALKEGMKYTQALKGTQISLSFLESLQEPPKGLNDYLDAWKNLPAPIRLGIESLIVAILIGATVLVIPKEYAPWSKTSTYTLVEINRELPIREDDEMNSTTTTLVTASTTTSTSDLTAVMYGPSTTLKSSATVAMAESIFKMFKPPAPIETPQPPIQTQVKTTTTTTLLAKKETKGRGEIYRVYMNANNVDEITPTMVEKILALGGEKAGEVELGWKRQQGRYFHFSMPESNLDQLKLFLQNLGPVRIVREPHVRVMPAGTIRLILWLETTAKNKNDTKESQSEEETE